MKRIFSLILFVLIMQVLSAQKGFGDCILKATFNIDSAIGDTVYNSLKWKDCVMDKPIPEMNFKTISGKSFDTEKLKGKVVVLNFWFIECIPCIAELPAFNKLVKEYKDKDVLFFGITFQSLKSLKEKFFPKHRFDVNIVQDATNITEMFAVGYPTTYIVDKNGIIKAAWNGGYQDERAVSDVYLKTKTVIDKLLSQLQ